MKVEHKDAATLLDRVGSYARAWRLETENVFETETSAIAFVNRGAEPLVLKVVKRSDDEWHSGEVLDAFDGHGAARVFEYTGGALLIERLRPGNSLVGLARDGNDEAAIEILAGVIQEMSAARIPKRCATVQDWARGFERYIATRDKQVPPDLVEWAERLYVDLSNSQRQTRLLHGDLHHDNVLFDSARGWLALDPKGVVGEVEYEIGAVLRNPSHLFVSRAIVERRIRQFTNRLELDFERTLAWGFAQAVLSAIWEVEDHGRLEPTNASLKLARVIQSML